MLGGLVGVVPRLRAPFSPFRAVRRLERVRPMVSVPWLGALVFCAVLCCVLPCCAAPFCNVLRCALLCRAAQCRVVPWCVLPSRGELCCAVPCHAVLCCAVLRPGEHRWCAVLRYVVLRRVVTCFAVLWCVVGPSYLRSGVGWRRRSLDWWPCCVGRGLRLSGWLVAGERDLAWCSSLSLCCGGLGVPFGLVGQAGVRVVALPRGLCLGPVSSEGSRPQGWAGFCGDCWGGPLGWVGSPPIPPLCLRVVPRPWCRGGVPCFFGARKFLCAVALRGAIRVSLSVCIPLPLCWCTLAPLCGDRWSVRATRCGSCRVRSVLRRRVLAGVRLRVGRPCA